MNLGTAAILGIVGLTALVSGCAAGAEDTESAASEATVVRLDTVTPAEVRAAAATRFAERLAVLVAAHPEIPTLTMENLDEFVQTRVQEGTWTELRTDHEVYSAVRSLLTFTEKTELSLAEVKAAHGPWLDGQLPAATIASGNVNCSLFSADSIGTACRLAADAKSIATAAPPAGVDMAAFVADWQRARGGSGARFVRPVKLVGDPTTEEVKSLAGVTSWCGQRGWGPAAVDAFVEWTPELAPYAGALKGPGMKKRWYWACGGNEWGESGFALLDQHNQLWAFTTYSSE